MTKTHLLLSAIGLMVLTNPRLNNRLQGITASLKRL